MPLNPKQKASLLSALATAKKTSPLQKDNTSVRSTNMPTDAIDEELEEKSQAEYYSKAKGKPYVSKNGGVYTDKSMQRSKYK